MVVRARLRTALAGAALALAAPAGAVPAPDRAMTVLATRLFPVLANWPDAGRTAPLATMLAARRQRLAACAGEPRCVLQAARWRDDERDALARAASGRRPAAGADGDPGAAVLREVGGIDGIIAVYGQDAPPHYPKIDGPDPAEAAANAAVAVALAAARADDPITALDPSIGLALALLDANDRDTAAAFEPLDAGLNGAARARARTIDWQRYRYTAIIVPGIGPEDLATPLSAAGKLNVQMAATLWQQRRAPFILVSGGTVHPRGTLHAEAVEMARALRDRFAVPAEAIIIEPYARHTTTNLRNATRRLAALGVPLDRPALISTNIEQSRYIAGPAFASRNQAELGYQPGEIGARLSPTMLEFRPSPLSLRIDPADPLDP